MANLPAISSLEFPSTTSAETTAVRKTFAWDFTTGDFTLKDGKLITVESKEYLKIWAEKTLSTIKGTLIYNTYGSEHHNYIGKVFDREFMQAELERTIKEALLTNTAITGISDFGFEIDGELLKMSFTINSIYGDAAISI